METRWLYTTSENFAALREASADTCLIPMGCVEKHGLHLPLGTDMLQASHIAYRASQLETVCVFPDFTFGDIAENYPNKPAGNISIPVETEMLLLEQLSDQIASNGFKKIIVYNGHGGNVSWLKTFLRKLENKPHDFVMFVVNIQCGVMERIAKAQAFKGLTEEDKELTKKCLEEHPSDGHAGYSETAYILGVAPDCVKMERLGIVSGKSLNLTQKCRNKGIMIRDHGWSINHPDWIDSDDPIGCNERIGQVAIKLESERLARAIKYIKEDENFIKWHNEAWGTNL